MTGKRPIFDALDLGVFKTTLLAATVFAYWFSYLSRSQLEFVHILAGAATLALFMAPRKMVRWKDLFLPLLFTLVLYDSQRIYSDHIRGAIHIVEPYAFDHRFFGITHQGSTLTPNEWWQKHPSAFLDVFCGFAYLIFLPEFFLLAAIFMFSSGEKEQRLAKKMTWGFFLLNALGYTTYYWYAAAPPWYVTEHGLSAAADLSVRASLAGCARFDEWVGLPLFKTWYGNSADVFGAVPSLHVAYPFLAIVYSFKIHRFRIWSIFFYVWVSFSAVYLNHHYVLDILWGSFYATLVGYFQEILAFMRGTLPSALTNFLRAPLSKRR